MPKVFKREVDLQLYRSSDERVVYHEYRVALGADLGAATSLLAYLVDVGRGWPHVPMQVFAIIDGQTIYVQRVRGVHVLFSLRLTPETCIIQVWGFGTGDVGSPALASRIRQRVHGPKGL